MDLIDVYGSYPDHLNIERDAVQKSTRYFPDIGTVCLKTQLDEYDKYMILDVRGDWLLIRVLNQLEYKSKGLYSLVGLVKEENIEKLPQKSIEKGLEKPFSDVIITAYKYLNVPYQWGAKSKRTTDCSGLTYQIYQEHGIILPRYADGQFHATKEIDSHKLQPGDLVFVIVDKPVHVLMYLDKGRMIESCGLPEIFTTRIITFKEKWGYNPEDLYNGVEISGMKIYFHRYIR